MSYKVGYPGTCPDCGTRREVSGTYDAALCPLCDEWQTPPCRRCAECRLRPEHPSQATDLDLLPQEVDPAYNLNLSDEAEVLRRVLLPVVRGTLPREHVRDVALRREEGARQEHWPADVPWPDVIYCVVTLSSGEREHIFLGEDGWVDPEEVAARLMQRLEDMWCESSVGWGQRITGSGQVLP